MSAPLKCAITTLAALVLVAGCGSNDQPKVAANPLYQNAVLSAEDLAAKLGCKPEMRTKAAELRQGICKTADGNYAVTSFTTEKGRKDWLDYALMYKGTHLVGRQWVVTAPPPVLETLRKKLGGELQSSDGSGSSRASGT
ncbi:hypothetical protein [Nonomuraea sp. NPDC049129]|uniref:hypothetical protein n=1 Tax=unclassified Nonomuraea TaxID=2593643 RepID=UPI0033EC28DA